MQVPKPTEADRDRFRALVPDDPRVEVKPMFGNLGGFVNGNMFMGLLGSAVGVKLAEADGEQLRAAGGGPFGPADRPMGGYVSLPVTASLVEAADWVQRALTHVAALPPKEPKRAGKAGSRRS